MSNNPFKRPIIQNDPGQLAPEALIEAPALETRTGCQLIWVSSASASVPQILCPSCHSSPNLSLLGTGTGLHSLTAELISLCTNIG